MLEVDEAFMWFEIARKDFEVNMMKRKSSAGIVAMNTFAN
jgi:hypothetical protein